MSTQVHLNNAPIVEGLIDIRVKPADGLQLTDLLAMGDLVKDRYPNRKEAVRIEAKIQLEPGGPAEQTSLSQTVGYRFDSTDGRHVLQVQHGGFTLSRLKPYETWENLLRETRRLWDAYISVAKPQAVTRIATRFINRIEFETAGLDFDDYLAMPPGIPKTLPQTVIEFLSRIVVGDRESGALIVMTQALEPQDFVRKTVAVIIDIDVFKEVTYSIESEDYWGLIEKFRPLKNNAFFGSITDKTLELLK